MVMYKMELVKGTFCVLFLLINAEAARRSFTPGTPQTVGHPWPLPQSFRSDSTVLQLDPATFRFNKDGYSCDILESAFDRYFKIIFGANYGRSTALHVVEYEDSLPSVSVKLLNECERYPSLQMDESYQMSINKLATISANSIWGILRALETFSQLVYSDGAQRWLINQTDIKDFPRFGHRGVLLDTSRHYLPLSVLKQNLDAMAYNKMNVFHWHIVDDQSFPYQSYSYPLAELGAYHPYTHIYTQAQVAELIEYGRLRGIRIVPEFDSPGHSQSWGPGVPGLLTECYKGGQPTGDYGPINPIYNTTYEFLKVFTAELSAVFPDKYLHLGGDEVDFSCWKSNPEVQAFMKKAGYGDDYSKLESYYMQNLLDIVGSHGNGYIIWQEVFDNGVKVRDDTVVEVWKDHHPEELAAVTKAGYRALLSSCWYLDYISYGADWRNYYQCEPLAFNGTDEQKKLVIGGELCLWAEYVDATNVLARLWPRGSAIAERLWSAVEVSKPDAALPRLEEHRCRMIGRGIPAEPVNGPGHCSREFYPIV